MIIGNKTQWFRMAVAGLALCVCLRVAFGQEAGTAAEAAGEELTTEEQVGVKTTLWGLIQQGGITMIPLGLLSVASIGLIIYGFVAVRADKMLRPELVPQLQDDLGNLDWESARSACTGSPCLLTNVLSAGLDRISDGVLDVPSMEKAMEEASVQEVTAGMRPINYLSIIAQVAPMLGLLGTVSGMIKAFQKIGLGGMGKPELLAADIGEAMVTTSTGMIIAIPTRFLSFYITSRNMSNLQPEY